MSQTRQASQREEQLTLGDDVKCPRCNGVGDVSLMGLPGRRTCPKCGGVGRVPREEEGDDSRSGSSH
jgi:DnaJ-class molecular chaperone